MIPHISREKTDDFFDHIKKDPFVRFSSVHDGGAAISSASGTVSGQTASAHSTDVGGGVIGTYDRWNKTFNLTANQTLVVGGQFTFDSSRTTFGASTLAPAFLNTGSVKQDRYGFAGGFQYYVGDLYFGGAIAGNLGHGNMTNDATGGAGGYGIGGYSTGATIGETFTLFGSPNSPTQTSPLPTKAPPKPADSGYALRLDLRGHIGYANEQADGFTDSTGFIWGAERFHSWDVGGLARLYATIPNGQWVWMPYVGATLNQQFGYKDALAIPAQPGQIADTIFYGSAQTFWGAQLGMLVQDKSGIAVGIRGIYQQSSEFQAWAGQAYLQYTFPR